MRPVPDIYPVGIIIDLLAHQTAGGQPHSTSIHIVVAHFFCHLIQRGRSQTIFLVCFGFHRVGDDLDPAMDSITSNLLFCGIPFTQRHGHKLPDSTFAHRKTIQPRLLRDDNIILRFVG